jgi:hypothetical protein
VSKNSVKILHLFYGRFLFAVTRGFCGYMSTHDSSVMVGLKHQKSKLDHTNAASQTIFLCSRKAMRNGGNSAPFIEELQAYHGLLSAANILQGISASTSLLAKQGL